MGEPESQQAGPLTARYAGGLGLAAIAVALGFAAFTAHAWEDYYITFRASLNLATGHGLVFQPGERVHSFTSPLGTLLPALFAFGGGEGVAERALWGLRIVSALALGGAVWSTMRWFQRDGIARFAAIAIGAAWLLDAKTVDFAINGMETALVVLFVVVTWRALAGGARLWPVALACTGLQWTRPDGCVFFAALAGAWLITGARGAGLSRRQQLARLLRGGVLGGALYLPWLIWAWSYYGSPIPHTILAKSGSHAASELAALIGLYPWRLLFGHVALHDLFMPAYFYFGGWPESLHWVSRALVLGGALAWVWPSVAPAGRLASGAFFLGGFYVNIIPASPWYFPGWQALAFIAWAYLLHAVWQAGARSAVRIVATLIVAVQAALLICVAVQMRAQQSLIETTHRVEIGRWLRQQAAAGDTVFLECLGYIGYYSELKMLDYPGLAAPEVVAARRAGRRTWAQIIGTLQPGWLVLRPSDATKIFAEDPALSVRYRIARTFDHRAAIDAQAILPGRGYLNFDAVFQVYRRGPETPRAP